MLPGIIVLSIGLSSALTARTTLRERYGGPECVVTSKRIIVAEWRQRRHLVEFEHRQIARITGSGSLVRPLVGTSATIHSIEGRRVKLDRLPEADELVEVVQDTLAASSY